MSEQTVLEEAGAVVYGPRQDNYGHPAINFARIAKAWSAILNIDVTAAQVGLCMIGLKLCREANKPTRDNLVDIAGYAATLEMVAERDTAPDDAPPASYPDIVDGDGDTWEFHHLHNGVPQYTMRHCTGVPHDADYIHAQYPPRHADEIVDGEGSTWVHVGNGEYTYRLASTGTLSVGYDRLTRQAPESIYERFGRPAA